MFYCQAPECNNETTRVLQTEILPTESTPSRSFRGWPDFQVSSGFSTAFRSADPNQTLLEWPQRFSTFSYVTITKLNVPTQSRAYGKVVGKRCNLPFVNHLSAFPGHIEAKIFPLSSLRNSSVRMD